MSTICIICGCQTTSDKSANLATCEILSDKDYSLISDVLNEYLIKIGGTTWEKRDTDFSEITHSTDSVNMIVLHDSTLNNFDGLSKNISRNRTEPFNNSRGLWEKIESLNDIRVGIDTSKITTLKTHILLKSESNEIFKNNVVIYEEKRFIV